MQYLGAHRLQHAPTYQRDPTVTYLALKNTLGEARVRPYGHYRQHHEADMRVHVTCLVTTIIYLTRPTEPAMQLHLPHQPTERVMQQTASCRSTAPRRHLPPRCLQPVTQLCELYIQSTCPPPHSRPARSSDNHPKPLFPNEKWSTPGRGCAPLCTHACGGLRTREHGSSGVPRGIARHWNAWASSQATGRP